MFITVDFAAFVFEAIAANLLSVSLFEALRVGFVPRHLLVVSKSCISAILVMLVSSRSVHYSKRIDTSVLRGQSHIKTSLPLSACASCASGSYLGMPKIYDMQQTVNGYVFFYYHEDAGLRDVSESQWRSLDLFWL